LTLLSLIDFHGANKNFKQPWGAVVIVSNHLQQRLTVLKKAAAHFYTITKTLLRRDNQPSL
jgi:hypothetical protein